MKETSEKSTISCCEVFRFYEGGPQIALDFTVRGVFIPVFKTGTGFGNPVPS
jgi:hypothetical protein